MFQDTYLLINAKISHNQILKNTVVLIPIAMTND